MSTSPSRAPVASPAEKAPPGQSLTDHGLRVQARQNNDRPLTEIQPFPYDAIPRAARKNPGGIPSGWPNEENTADAAVREAQIRTEGRQQGQAEARKAFDDQLARERAAVVEALTQFTRDRARYFQKIEGEVVQLALAIARKILHREAQVDPLLLAGIVRVALEKIGGATGVRLRLHPTNAHDWRRYLSTHLEPSDLPEIVEDPALPSDRCTLETAMGTASVGLEVQMKEIEQGLMDLLSARPGATP